jgi:hypothetical protein
MKTDHRPLFCSLTPQKGCFERRSEAWRDFVDIRADLVHIHTMSKELDVSG